jgi:hypothetical protein
MYVQEFLSIFKDHFTAGQIEGYGVFRDLEITAFKIMSRMPRINWILYTYPAKDFVEWYDIHLFMNRIAPLAGINDEDTFEF